MGFDFTPEEEDGIVNEFDALNKRMASTKATVSADLAKNVSDFYQQHPDANPYALLPAAKAFTEGKMTQDQANSFLRDITLREMQQAIKTGAPKKKDWMERNVTDKLKTASRYTMAGLNFVPQFVQGGVGQIFDKNDSVAGWFISTDLGSLIANDEVAGEGFFIGGRAADLQAERARRYRGEIDGKAFTIGRGVAHLVAQPGTREYNIISGLADAAVALAVPSVPGGKATTAALKGLAGEGKAAIGLRSLVGLTDFESAAINPMKVAGWLTSSSGRKVVEKLAGVKTIDEGLEIFPRADMKFLTELAKADTTSKVDRLLRDTLGLGDVTRGVAARSIDDINISRIDDIRRAAIGQRSNKMARLMSAMPGQHLVLVGGSDREIADTVKNVKNYLKMLRVNDETRIDMVDEFARALVNNNGEIRGVVDQYEKLVRTAFDKLGVTKPVQDDLLRSTAKFKEIYDKDLYGAVANSGDAADFGGTFTAVVDGNVVTVNQPLATAGLQSEMLKHSMMLPDPRRTRRLVSKIGWITGTTGSKALASPRARLLSNEIEKLGGLTADANGMYKVGNELLTERKLKSLINTKTAELNDLTASAGNLRMPLAAIEWAQNEIWRPFTLMTGGYVLRNMTDSLLRQSFAPGIKTGIFHPIELIQTAIYKKYRGDILGELFDRTPEELIRSGHQEMAEAVAGSLRERVDPLTRHSREYTTSTWRRVRRGDGIQEFSKAVASEVALLHQDDFARLYAQGKTFDDILDYVVNDPNGKKYLENLQNRWKNRTLVDSQSGQKTVGSVQFIDAQGNVNRANLEQFFNKYIAPRVDAVTGRDARLMDVIGNAAYTDGAGELVDAFRYAPGGQQVIGYEDSFLKEINDIVNDPNIILKDTYKSKVTDYLNVPGQKANRSQLLARYDKMVDKFFSELYPKREAFLNKSPVFRKFYYAEVNRLADMLNQGAADEIISSLRTVAGKEGAAFTEKWLGNYLGDADTAQKLWEISTGVRKTTGKLSREQLDAYAKGFALDETKKLFYSAAEKSNFADIHRVISPFASAWSDVMKRWVGDISKNPEILRKGGVTVQGLKNADPDADGRGFFFKDPQSGEYVFNYPFSSELAPFMGALTGVVGGAFLGGAKGALIGGLAGGGAGAVAQTKLDGVDAVLQAPAKTLNMGFNVFPGIGPFAQVAANKIIPEKPQLDWVRSKLVPYGAPSVGLLTAPAWADKFFSAIVADPENDRILGDLTIDTMKALSTTGKYDLTTADGRDQLHKDAVEKARVLLLLRSLGQFTGPTRPTVEFKVDTKQGDVYANELAKIFRQYQSENYDTAVSRFMETFGDDVFLYMAGKTKSAVGGLDASKEFGRWERDNSGVVSKYPEIAGFFAPVGSNFDYQVYLRQIETGKRTRISPDDLVMEAQSLVGKAAYRYLTRSVGPNPNDAQQALLREARTILQDQFPGFAQAPLDLKTFDRRILQLQEAASDPDLADNKIAQGTQAYLQLRDAALAKASERGVVSLSAKTNTDLRGLLRQAGEALCKQIPEFQRLWDRLLSQEVDL